MMQPDLFAAHAADRRDLGIARAQRRAERECGPTWTDAAAEYLAGYARGTFGQPFLIEDAIVGCPLQKPSNPRAWGAAVQKAARAGWIVKTGGSAPARTSNCGLKALWTLNRP